MNKCWICGSDCYEDLECTKCGPEQPWGPTPEEIAYWRSLYKGAPLSERDPEAYEEAMRDAGRGHLLP